MACSRTADDAGVAAAAEHLRAGGVVAFPTETVYGLGAATFHPDAIRKVYRMKGRPADNPLIAHVVDAAGAQCLVRGWDQRCDRLAARFWPGPLALVLDKAATVPSVATGDRPTVAVRAPAHPVARALLHAFGAPVSAPSANRSGDVSATSAAHVAHDFGDEPDLLILDGGACPVGIESTVLDLTGDPPRVLRPGSIGTDAIASVLDLAPETLVSTPLHTQDASPGTAPRHYAPGTPATLIDPPALDEAVRAGPDSVVLVWSRATVPRAHAVIVMPSDAAAYARALYAALRDADTRGGRRILIERPPRGPDWDAVHDRLTRATARG